MSPFKPKFKSPATAISINCINQGPNLRWCECANDPLQIIDSKEGITGLVVMELSPDHHTQRWFQIRYGLVGEYLKAHLLRVDLELLNCPPSQKEENLFTTPFKFHFLGPCQSPF